MSDNLPESRQERIEEEMAKIRNAIETTMVALSLTDGQIQFQLMGGGYEQMLAKLREDGHILSVEEVKHLAEEIYIENEGKSIEEKQIMAGTIAMQKLVELRSKSES